MIGVVTMLIEEMCSKVRLLSAKCECEDELYSGTSNSSEQVNDQRAYKIIVLFQNTALPSFFKIVLELFEL